MVYVVFACNAPLILYVKEDVPLLNDPGIFGPLENAPATVEELILPFKENTIEFNVLETPTLPFVTEVVVT